MDISWRSGQDNLAGGKGAGSGAREDATQASLLGPLWEESERQRPLLASPSPG